MTLPRLLRLVAIMLSFWGLTLWYGLGALAQSVAPTAPQPDSITDLTFGQIMVLMSNFGIGGLVFFIWLYDMKRQVSLEDLNKKYQDNAAAHLQAFKDINEAYRTLAEDTNRGNMLGVQVQTRLVEKLERMEREHDKHGGQHERG